MSTTFDPAVERLTIMLPVSVVSALRAEAQAQGRDAESLAADRLSNLYAVATNEPQTLAPHHAPDKIEAALHGPAHRFDPEAIRKKYREKYGTPDLSHLSREELEQYTEDALSRVDPKKLAEAERLGLI